MPRSRDGLISSQFIEVIEWIDDTNNTIIYKFPVHDNQIKHGAQLIVRESQTALFLNEGEIIAQFAPGRHILTTKNIPVLTKLQSWKQGFESPYKADVYFISTKQFVGFKWGTRTPIVKTVPKFGTVRLGCRGRYSFRVVHAVKYFRNISGTRSLDTVDTVIDDLRSKVVAVFTDTLARTEISVDNPKYLDLSRQTLSAAKQHFIELGIEISDFIVESISLPEAVEEVVDGVTSITYINNTSGNNGLNTYKDFMVAKSIPDAVKTPGGLAAIGPGMLVAQQIAGVPGGIPVAPHPSAAVPVTPPLTSNSGKKVCGNCKNTLPNDAEFCPNCGTKTGAVHCIKCGTGILTGSMFCHKCGRQL